MGVPYDPFRGSPRFVVEEPPTVPPEPEPSFGVHAGPKDRAPADQPKPRKPRRRS